MKRNHTIFLFLFLFGIGYSQNSNDLKLQNYTLEYSINDTIPKVVYPKKWEVEKPLYVFNKLFTASEFVTTMAPTVIESIEIPRGEIIKINNIEYVGKILIKTKANYNLKLVKVKDFLTKYTDLKDKNLLFSVNGKLLNEDPDLILVDEKTIMQIKIEKLDKIQNSQNLYIIDLITRTPENLEKANTIYIRGKDDLTLNKTR